MPLADDLGLCHAAYRESEDRLATSAVSSINFSSVFDVGFDRLAVAAVSFILLSFASGVGFGCLAVMVGSCRSLAVLFASYSDHSLKLTKF